MGVAYHSYTNASHVNVSTYGDIDALAHLLKSHTMHLPIKEQLRLIFRDKFREKFEVRVLLLARRDVD